MPDRDPNERIDLSQAPLPTGPRRPSAPRRKGNGTGTAADEYARPVMWTAFILSLLLLLFLLAGLYSGAWGKTALHQLSPGDVNRQFSNAALVFRLLQLSTLVAVAGLLIVAFRDELVGYVLIGLGLLFYVGVPALTGFVYTYRALKPSSLTQTLMQDFQLMSGLLFVPGLLWAGADLVRRFQVASEAAAVQRVNSKYGANVPRQKTKQRQQFLGTCWQLPYCRDGVRERCPIFLKKRGPCWWHKEGCMCEERIILQAVIQQDWKQKAARADAALTGNKSSLTDKQKRDRCRNCVIYNEHQKQKYKAMVTTALVLLPVVVYWQADALQNAAVSALANVERIMDRFSFGQSSGSISFLHGDHSLPIEWTLIGVVCILGLTQVLRLIEVWCFKLKW